MKPERKLGCGYLLHALLNKFGISEEDIRQLTGNEAQLQEGFANWLVQLGDSKSSQPTLLVSKTEKRDIDENTTTSKA